MRQSQRVGESSLPRSNDAARAALKSPFLITLQDYGFLFQCTSLSTINTLDLIHVGLLIQIMVL